MLKYNGQDQYHEVILNRNNISFTGEIIEESDTHITLEALDVTKNVGITGRIKIEKKNIQQIKPVILENMTLSYICAFIYPRKIKGIDVFDQYEPSPISKHEYYAVQVPAHADEDYQNEIIKSYLNKYVSSWGGYRDVTKEDYDTDKAISHEANFVSRHGENAQTILSILKLLEIDERFQIEIASQMMLNFNISRAQLRNAVRRSIGQEPDNKG